MNATIVNEHPIANYSTAGQLAAVFEAKSRRAIELSRELAEVISDLNTEFKGVGHKAFTSETTICGSTEEKQIARELKRVAWRTLIERLGMRKVMSTKRIAEMDDALSTGRRSKYYNETDPVDQLPEISADSIMDVLSGYAASAGEFMTEKVHEVYEFFKPWQSDTYKTNEKNRWKLSDKLIQGYAVEACYSGKGFRVSYGKTGDMIQALDSVMHLLDGKGIPESHYGPLVSDIVSSKASSGETTYFRWKCFLNRNIHLVMKRRDLVDEFNFICGHERELPGQATGGRYERHSKQQETEGVEAGKNGNYDLFETPESLAEQMCELAGITEGSTVLEPSAGPGRIVRAARAMGAIVTAIEAQEGLMQERCTLITRDFLQVDPTVFVKVDAVVMNPPFSSGQDAIHIRHAHQFLKPSGTLVAVASAGVTFRSDRRSVEFREWLKQVDATVTELPANSFEESGTKVNTVLIVIRNQ